MYFHEEKMDLLRVPQEYRIAHCVSGDFALGAGVAKAIENAFHVREILLKKYAPFGVAVPCCCQAKNVYNLVTKQKYWQKPTLDSLRGSLVEMKRAIEKDGVKKIAMPRIGCGLDRLKWNDVKEVIQEVFDDTDLEILVCYL